MASSARRTSFLSPEHREDVLFVIYSIDVPPSINEVGTDKRAVRSFSRADLLSYCNPDRHGRNVVGLLLGSLKAEYPIGETSHQAATFINQFIAVKGDFLKGKLRALGWVHSSNKIDGQG